MKNPAIIIKRRPPVKITVMGMVTVGKTSGSGIVVVEAILGLVRPDMKTLRL